MKRIQLAGMLAVVAVTVFATSASAKNITSKKFAIKDHATDTTKRQIQLQSKADTVLYSDADNPKVNGAMVHVWSSTDSSCHVLAADNTLWADNGKGWKYKNSVTKNQAQIADGKLQIKLRSGVTFSLADNGTQGAVNASIQFGTTGARYCMKCEAAGAINSELKFQAKDCIAQPCDLEPVDGACGPVPTTTTTTTTSTTTTTLPGTVVGAIATPGRMNINLTLGLPGAEAACNSNFAGSHVCRISEIMATPAADMIGLKDTALTTVTSFWAVDSTRPFTGQCGATDTGGPVWTYATGHLGVGGDSVTLNNATGVVSAVSPGGGVVRNCNQGKWVGCCKL